VQLLAPLLADPAANQLLLPCAHYDRPRAGRAGEAAPEDAGAAQPGEDEWATRPGRSNAADAFRRRFSLGAGGGGGGEESLLPEIGLLVFSAEARRAFQAMRRADRGARDAETVR
jgi:hypothetical protein